MIHEQRLDVVLIDFGFTCKLGATFVAGGTEHFIEDHLLSKSQKGEMIKISPKKDFYPFSLICVLLLERYPPFNFNVRANSKEKEEFVRQCTEEQLCCKEEIL